MYAIYADDDLVYSSGAASSLGYSASTAKITTEINKAGSLEFTIPPTNPSYSKMSKLKTIFRVEQDGIEIWRGRLLNDEKDFYNSKENFCEGELAFLNDAVVPPYNYSSGVSLQSYFRTIVGYYTNNCSDYRKIVAGTITAADPSLTTIRMKSDDYSDVMTELMDKLVGSIGGYLRLRHQNGTSYLDYLDTVEETSDQEIIFGKNLLDLTEYVDASDVYTYMIPLGKKDDKGNRVDITSVNGGKNYIYSSTGENLFGRITRAVAWDDITDPATLKSNGQKLLSSVIEMATTIEISAIDLKLLGVDVDRLEVGKFVHVQSPPHGIDSNFLCSKIVLDLLEPDRSEYTFGLVFTALTDKQISTNKLSENSYKTAQSTSDEYSNLRTEVYKNYTSSAEFDAFKAEVEQSFQEIGDFNPETYLTVLDAQATYATSAEFDAFKAEVEQKFQEIGDFNSETYLTILDAQATYATIEALQSLEERVAALEQNEGGTE